MYHDPALAQKLAGYRIAELRRSARPTVHGPRQRRRSSLIAEARLGTGWLLIDLGLRLAMPHRGPNRPALPGRR